MKLIEKISRFFRAADGSRQNELESSVATGYMAFSHTGQVVAARKALLASGLKADIKAPPPALREGCDMVIEFPVPDQAAYLFVLEENKLQPLKIAAADGPLTAPESLFHRTFFPDHLMVSAANMKLTIERQSGRIVNISGGGCPDVPALAAALMGRSISEADYPEELSRSLCSFSLIQARDEAARCFAAGLPESSQTVQNTDMFDNSSLPWPKKKPKAKEKPWLIVGTLADPKATLAEGPFTYQDGQLIWAGREIPPERGTAALMAAYALCAEALGLKAGRAVLAGDSGDGQGSRQVYNWLLERAAANSWSGLTFHYLFPLAESHDRIFLALDELRPRPILAADAGFMYVAKLCGQAPEYDLFTPDQGEMAYLADPKAPHPFYTRGALIQKKEPDEDTFADAYRENNTAESMLVKGRNDNIVWRGRIVHRIEGPDIPALEAIGGTGDTATGLASAFMSAGFSPARAAALAAHFNRRAGLLAAPDPGRPISSMLEPLFTLLAREISAGNI